MDDASRPIRPRGALWATKGLGGLRSRELYWAQRVHTILTRATYVHACPWPRPGVCFVSATFSHRSRWACVFCKHLVDFCTCFCLPCSSGYILLIILFYFCFLVVSCVAQRRHPNVGLTYCTVGESTSPVCYTVCIPLDVPVQYNNCCFFVCINILLSDIMA